MPGLYEVRVGFDVFYTDENGSFLLQGSLLDVKNRKNLTDELVATYVTAFAPYRQVLVPYAPPKTYGVTLVWNY